MNNDKKFKAGDKVYCPVIGNQIFTLEKKSDDPLFQLCINYGDNRSMTFNERGRMFLFHQYHFIFHATSENKDLLEKLYGVELEAQKPEMIKIGNFEFPKPVSEPLKKGETYYVPWISGWSLHYVCEWCSGMYNDEILLEKGLVHKTKEAAIQHAKVLIAINQGKTSLEN